jgi:hypothetical protein
LGPYLPGAFSRFPCRHGWIAVGAIGALLSLIFWSSWGGFGGPADDRGRRTVVREDY